VARLRVCNTAHNTHATHKYIHIYIQIHSPKGRSNWTAVVVVAMRPQTFWHSSSQYSQGRRQREIELGEFERDGKRKRRKLAAVGSQQTPSSELKPNHLQAAKSVNV